MMLAVWVVVWWRTVSLSCLVVVVRARLELASSASSSTRVGLPGMAVENAPPAGGNDRPPARVLGGWGAGVGAR